MTKDITPEYVLGDLRYLQLLARSFPTVADASTEIINLEAILNLPKGTEHFLSDIHGEHQAFNHVLKNASGAIKRKVNEIFSIGAIMSIISLAFLWIIYVLYNRLKERKILATGITFLLAIPFTLLINSILSRMIGEAEIDIWDILSIFILLIIAVAFIIGDCARRKRNVR